MKQKNKEFGLLMKFLREREDISARQLSLKSDLSSSYVSKIENGTTVPTLETFARIIKQMKVSSREVYYLISILGRDD